MQDSVLIEGLELKGDVVDARLAAIRGIVPWLPAVLGAAVPKTKLFRAAGTVSSTVAEMVCRLAHIPSSMVRGSTTKGVKTILRARAFLARLLLRCQAAGFAELLGKLSAFKSGAEGGHLEERVAVLGVCHAWGESRQMLREQAQQPGARTPRQQVARDVLVQNSMVHAMCIQAKADGMTVHNRAETFLIPPLEIEQKTAAALLTALLMGAAVRFGSAESMQHLSEKVSGMVLTFWCDAASSNRRLLKHVVASCESFPKNILVDCSELCLLHELHRVRVSLVEAHSSVSLAYCLAKLARSGSVMGLVSDYICAHIDNKCTRRMGKPPPEEQAKNRKIMDLLFRLDAAHHIVQRGSKTTKSQLAQDIEAVLALDNGDHKAGFAHYCWSESKGGPCCGSLKETKERMKAAYLNLFVARGLPVGALSRWTHIGIIYNMLVSGFCFRDLFAQALLHGLRRDEAAEERLRQVDPATIGAGDADRQHEHQARVSKVRAWLQKPDTRFQVVLLSLAMKNFDALTYFLMGGEREGEGEARRPRRPRTLPRCEEPIPIGDLVSRVLRMQGAFASTLATWMAEGAPGTLLLEAMSVHKEDALSESALRFVRRHCVGFSSGVC